MCERKCARRRRKKSSWRRRRRRKRTKDLLIRHTRLRECLEGQKMFVCQCHDVSCQHVRVGNKVFVRLWANFSTNVKVVVFFHQKSSDQEVILN